MERADYITLRTEAGTAYGVAGLPEAELVRLLEDPAGLLWRHIGRPVKISHDGVMVQAVLPMTGQDLPVAFKRYRERNWWKALCSLIRSPRAFRAWRLGRALLSKDIATPLPVAACCPRNWPESTTSYLATEWIEDAEHLHQFGWRLAGLPLDERLRSAARCAESLGRLIGRMHAAGVNHRDLKGANLLVVEGGDSLTTWLVDLDGVRLRRRISPRRRAANLARLAAGLEAHPWVTRTVCCRFLRAYAGQFPPGSIAWKPLWRAVAARSRWIVRRKRRRQQRVL